MRIEKEKKTNGYSKLSRKESENKKNNGNEKLSGKEKEMKGKYSNNDNKNIKEISYDIKEMSFFQFPLFNAIIVSD